MHQKGGVIIVLLVLPFIMVGIVLWSVPESFTWAQADQLEKISESTPLIDVAVTSSMEAQKEVLPTISADISTTTEAASAPLVSDKAVPSTEGLLAEPASVLEPQPAAAEQKSSVPDAALKQPAPIDSVLKKPDQIFFENKNYGKGPFIEKSFITNASFGEPQNSFDLAENTSQYVYMSGIYSHPGGCGQVVAEKTLFKVFRSGVGGDCAENEENCYGQETKGFVCNMYEVKVDVCEQENPEDVIAAFECAVPIHYLADPTDSGEYEKENWVAQITLFDRDGNSFVNESPFEINTLAAVDISPTLEYGPLKLGEISGRSSMQIANTGNKSRLNLAVSGTPLLCTSGVIPVENVRYGFKEGEEFESMTQLSEKPTSVVVGLQKKSNPNKAADLFLYWQLQVPSVGAGGACNGTITVVGE